MSDGQEDINEVLKGKTLQIYWYLLRSGNSGVREIQKKLKISSSSTVHYHLNKLVSLGLVKQDKMEKYFIEEKVKIGIIGLYIKIGRRMIPRMLFYLSFFGISGVLFVTYLILRPHPLQLSDLLFLLFSIVGIGIFLYETYKIWNMQPL
ncbi:helix-turn-helix domain-containing protein [Candidatus Hodarchaeum mangrovi]